MSKKVLKLKVEIWEFERGWGRRLDKVKYFTDVDEAEKFVKNYNAKNTEETAPDWYMIAYEPKPVIVEE